MTEKCECRQCLRDRKEGTQIAPGIFISAEMQRMVLCPKCGNKRCPHATDHRHECTNSNAPGQEGSYYGNWVSHNGEVQRPAAKED